MTTDVPGCIKDLCAVTAATEEFRGWQPFEVRIRCGTVSVGILIPSGSVSDGRSATCAVEGDVEILQKVLSGSTTLQSAHLSGAVHVSGNPQQLLQVSVLIDRLRATP
jgi:hypothetical protein